MKRSRRKILCLPRTANSSTVYLSPVAALFLVISFHQHIYFVMLVFMHTAEKHNASPSNVVVLWCDY